MSHGVYGRWVYGREHSRKQRTPAAAAQPAARVFARYLASGPLQARHSTGARLRVDSIRTYASVVRACVLYAGESRCGWAGGQPPPPQESIAAVATASAISAAAGCSSSSSFLFFLQ